MELETTTGQTKLELDIIDRYNLAVEWVQAAREIADRSNSERARQLLEFIEEQTTLGVPMPGGYIQCFFVDRDPDLPMADYAFITPIVHKDVDRLPAEDRRRKLFKREVNSLARYSEGSRAIYLPDLGLSKTSVGIFLLHETAHAWLDVVGKIDRNYPEAHWLEEADIYEFEFELLSALGGEVYQNALKKLVDSIRSLDNNPALLSTNNEMSDGEKAQFAEALGISGEQEINIWLSVCAFNAFFEYFKKHDDNPRYAFAMFLKAKHLPHE